MNPFSRYLVIPQYFYFKHRVMVFTNTAHPYLHLCRTVLNSGEHHTPGDWSVSRLQAHPD